MKKALICILVFLTIISISVVPIYGIDTDKVESTIPDSAKEIIGNMDMSETDSALDKIIEYAQKAFSVILKDVLHQGAMVLLIPIICALANTVYDRKLPDIITTAGVLSIAALCITDSDSFIGLGRNVVDELNSFSKVLLPALTASAAASGAITSAAAKYAAGAFFFDVLVYAGERLVIPLIYAYMAVSVGNAAFGGGLESASKLIKWLTGMALTIFVTCFTLYLTITGLITGTADAAATKLTKTALSTVLPVVGSIISDAAATVVNGTAMLKNTIGIFGMIIVLCVCLVPFLRLGMSYLAFKGIAALTQPLGGDRLGKVVSAVGTAMGMMLGYSGAVAVILYISIISIMKVVI